MYVVFEPPQSSLLDLPRQRSHISRVFTLWTNELMMVKAPPLYVKSNMYAVISSFPAALPAWLSVSVPWMAFWKCPLTHCLVCDLGHRPAARPPDVACQRSKMLVWGKQSRLSLGRLSLWVPWTIKLNHSLISPGTSKGFWMATYDIYIKCRHIV